MKMPLDFSWIALIYTGLYIVLNLKSISFMQTSTLFFFFCLFGVMSILNPWIPGNWGIHEGFGAVTPFVSRCDYCRVGMCLNVFCISVCSEAEVQYSILCQKYTWPGGDFCKFILMFGRTQSKSTLLIHLQFQFFNFS